MKSCPHFRPRLLWVLTLSAALTGCASMQSHDKLASDVQSAGRTGGIPAALAQLEASAKSEDDKTALLYNLERASCCMDRRYEDSTNAFLLADIKVKEWEETAKTNPPSSWARWALRPISERLKNYEGQDYEKVWLTTRLAMNRVALGDFENARVDIKRTHEREAIIAEFRSETLAAKKKPSPRAPRQAARSSTATPSKP